MSAENLHPVRRVVITGIGAVTPLGLNVETLWKACLSGCSGVSLISDFDVSDYPTRLAAQIKEWDPSPYMEKKEARRMDRFVQFAVAAARMAADDSGLTIDDSNRDRVGVFIGSGVGGLATIEEQHKVLLERGVGRISPFLIPGIICDMGAGMTSIVLGARGPNSCVTTACATGTNNIGDAYEAIKRGDPVSHRSVWRDSARHEPCPPVTTHRSVPAAPSIWSAMASSWARAPG
jgi:3-oxoacyl-[acyl-carrier-protein] synthase II